MPLFTPAVRIPSYSIERAANTGKWILPFSKRKTIFVIYFLICLDSLLHKNFRSAQAGPGADPRSRPFLLFEQRCPRLYPTSFLLPLYIPEQALSHLLRFFIKIGCAYDAASPLPQKDMLGWSCKYPHMPPRHFRLSIFMNFQSIWKSLAGALIKKHKTI